MHDRSLAKPPQHGFAQQYGYFEMSAKRPDADGGWPAFWLVGTNREARFGARARLANQSIVFPSGNGY